MGSQSKGNVQFSLNLDAMIKFGTTKPTKISITKPETVKNCKCLTIQKCN